MREKTNVFVIVKTFLGEFLWRVKIIMAPVGMQGRAIKFGFVRTKTIWVKVENNVNKRKKLWEKKNEKGKRKKNRALSQRFVFVKYLHCPAVG